MIQSETRLLESRERAKMEAIARDLRVTMDARIADPAKPPTRLEDAPLNLYSDIEGGGKFFNPTVLLPKGGYMVSVTPSADEEDGCYHLDVSVQTTHGVGFWQAFPHTGVRYCGENGFKGLYFEILDTYALTKSIEKKQEPDYRTIQVWIKRAK
jgi:hypothetical protein